MKTATRTSLVVALAFIAACSSGTGPLTQPADPVAGFIVAPGAATVLVGDTVRFAARLASLDSLPATSDSIHAPVGPVSWSVSDSRVAAIEGQAGQSALVRAIHEGTTTVTAALGGHTASAVLVIPRGSPGVAARLAFTIQPGNTTAGAAFLVAVTIEDSSGHPVTSTTNAVTVALNTGPCYSGGLQDTIGNRCIHAGATLSGTTTVTAVNGVARLANLHIDRVGTAYTLTATDSGLREATSSPFSIMSGPVSATQSTVSALAYILMGAGISTIRVNASDARGNPIVGAIVVLAATGSGNTLVQPASLTDSSGMAIGSLSSTVAETKIVSATINGTAIAQTASVAVEQVSAVQSTVSVAPVSIALPCERTTITVTARDAAGTPLAGAPVVLTATGSGNTLTQPGGPTDVNGLATATLGSTVAETKTVSATINGTAIAQTATLMVTLGPPSQLCFSVQPRFALVGNIIVPAPQVTATDASGNVATGFSGSVTMAIGANPTGATLSGTTTVAAVNGVATFPNLRIGIPGTYTLTAMASGFTGATSAPFRVWFPLR